MESGATDEYRDRWQAVMKWRSDCSALYPGNADYCGLERGSWHQWKRRLRILARGAMPRLNIQSKWR